MGTKGKYGMIEGPDGSGKSTIVKMLREDTFSLPVKMVREPGGTPMGEAVRAMFGTFPELCAAEKFHLMFASRAALKAPIEEMLKEAHVISDRGFPSTYAFQIYGEWASELENSFWANVASDAIAKPDFIITLDVDVATGNDRVKGARKDVGIKAFDEATSAFKERVRAGYRAFDHYRWQVQMVTKGVRDIRFYQVDASFPLEEVYQKVRDICVQEF